MHPLLLRRTFDNPGTAGVKTSTALEQVLETNPALSWVADDRGRILYANTAWRRATGLELGELADLDFTTLVHPEDVGAMHELQLPVAAGSASYEYRLRHADGRFRWVRESVNHAPPGNEPVATIGCGFDIHNERSNERLLTVLALRQTSLTHFSERALREEPGDLLNHEALQLLCEILQLPQALLILADPDDGIYRPAAARGVATTDFQPLPADAPPINHTCELPGDRSQFPLHPADIDRLGDTGAFAVPIGRSSPPYGYLIGFHSHAFVLHAEVLQFARSLAAILAISIERDLATQKLAQSERRTQLAQKMEAVGTLAGAVAHDFNNLLTAIRCFADLLREELEHENQRRKLDDIIHACSSATHLVRQLLTFSRKEVTQTESLDLNTFVSDLHGFVRSLLSEHIEIHIDTADQPAWIRADRRQLEQTFFNLCLNARDAMPTEGRLSIKITVETCEQAPTAQLLPGRYVKLSVADNGAGIDPALAERIFQPFFTTKPKGKGTGLGLATCLAIMREINGDISLDSRIGEGSTFSLWFPEDACMFQEDWTPPAPPEIDSAKATILLVEDDSLVRLVANALIENVGHHVISYGLPAEALAHAESQGLADIDLVVTDIVMPGMNGHALVQSLRAIKPDLKAVFMSGYIDNPATEAAICDPEVLFLPKPFSGEDFLAILKKALART